MVMVRKLKAAALCSGIILTACNVADQNGSKAKDDPSTAPADNTEKTDKTKDEKTKKESAVAVVKDVADLKLASAFKLDLPSALTGGSTSLRLAGGKRSQEACQMGSTVKETTRSLQEVSGFFCHIEIEKDNISLVKRRSYLLKVMSLQIYGLTTRT